jgi:hypothetical protein
LTAFEFPGPGNEILFEQPLAAVVDLQPGIYDVSITMQIFTPEESRSLHLQQLAELTHLLEMEFVSHENPPACEFSDSDNDGDIDVRDFYVFQQCFGGPAQ